YSSHPFLAIRKVLDRARPLMEAVVGEVVLQSEPGLYGLEHACRCRALSILKDEPTATYLENVKSHRGGGLIAGINQSITEFVRNFDAFWTIGGYEEGRADWPWRREVGWMQQPR